jgi:hypothetical protein
MPQSQYRLVQVKLYAVRREVQRNLSQKQLALDAFCLRTSGARTTALRYVMGIDMLIVRLINTGNAGWEEAASGGHGESASRVLVGAGTRSYRCCCLAGALRTYPRRILHRAAPRSRSAAVENLLARSSSAHRTAAAVGALCHFPRTPG